MRDAKYLPPASIAISSIIAQGSPMPVYEYLCDDCGAFTDMRPMAECDLPLACPQCETESPRVILTAPNFFCMPSDKRKAHVTNERSAHAPRTLDQYKAAHGPGCGCCSTG